MDDVKQSKLDYLNKLISQALQLSSKMLSNTLISLDFPFLSVLDRNVHLLRGVMQHFESNNLLCAGALLRLQIDNCLKIYAFSIVDNADDLNDWIKKGNSIEKYKNGKDKLSDKYLRDELSKIFPKVNPVYEQSSGYIHFSVVNYSHAFSVKDNGILEGTIGVKNNDKDFEYLLECIDAFIYFTELLYKLVNDWINQKLSEGF